MVTDRENSNMRKMVILLVSFLNFTGISIFAQDTESGGGEYRDPSRFEKAIEAFESADKESPPEPGGIVCIGSSSMMRWDDIKTDLAPLSIIHRGFGGSNMNDALYFADRIVLPYKPRAILMYEGD